MRVGALGHAQLLGRLEGQVGIPAGLGQHQGEGTTVESLSAGVDDSRASALCDLGVEEGLRHAGEDFHDGLSAKDVVEVGIRLAIEVLTHELFSVGAGEGAVESALLLVDTDGVHVISFR